MDFTGLKLSANSPVYVQMAAHVKRAVALGWAKDGDPLPSRREAAAQLGVNPNTVQKAYRLMEEEGYIQTPQNAASAIRVTPELSIKIEEELSRELVARFVAEARGNGLTRETVDKLVDELWITLEGRE